MRLGPRLAVALRVGLGVLWLSCPGIEVVSMGRLVGALILPFVVPSRSER